MNANLLCGTSVRLTALSKEDAPVIARWSEDGEYLRLQDTHTALPQTEAQAASEIEKVGESRDTIGLGIRKVEDGALIGTVEFCEIEWNNQCAWLGFGIGERTEWGKRYGTEALQLALRYAFTELNFYRLTLTVIATNERAIALYEGAGFKREGVFREFGLRDGRRYDMYLYGLLRTEWEAAPRV